MDTNWYNQQNDENSEEPVTPETPVEEPEEVEVDSETRKELGIEDSELLTQDLLQSKLAEYQRAYQQEYESGITETTSDDDVKSITQDFFRRNVPIAAAQIVWLASNSSSDSVRGSMSKYVIQMAFDEEKDSGDPIKNLLRELSGNDNKPQPENAKDES